MLVGQKRDHHADRALEEGKRHVEADQARQDARELRARRYGLQDCIVRLDDRLLRHKVVVERVHHIVVGYHTEQCHEKCSDARADDRALLRLLVTVD